MTTYDVGVTHWIVKYLRDNGPCRRGFIYDQCPFGRNRTTEALKSLIDGGLVTAVGRTIHLCEELTKTPQNPTETPQNAPEPSRAPALNALGSKNLTSEALGSTTSSIPRANGKTVFKVIPHWYDEKGQFWADVSMVFEGKGPEEIKEARRLAYEAFYACQTHKPYWTALTKDGEQTIYGDRRNYTVHMLEGSKVIENFPHGMKPLEPPMRMTDLEPLP